MKTVHTLVIGAGSGGITAAVTAAGFGKKVLLVDKNLPGGECTWSGCVPSKALIYQAHLSHSARIKVPSYVPDTREAMNHVHRVRERVYTHETPEALEKMGIEFLQGRARFIDSHRVDIGGILVQAKKIIITTGSTALVPQISGLDQVPYLTNESLFELDELPKSIIVLGGGPIGVELSQAMNRLGVEVKLVEMMDRIMPREESDLTEPLTKLLEAEGVEIHTGTRAERVCKPQNLVQLHGVSNGGNSLVLEAEAILLALGRKPNIDDLGLEKAGVLSSSKGITVNRRMQTSRSHIFAVGDVVGPWLFSHMANVQGIQAVQNALLPFKRRVSDETPVWVTFTSPELARAGLTEDEARGKFGESVRVYDFDMNDLDRNRTGEPGIERVKLVLDKKGRVLGSSILAERAGEMIGEIQVLRKSKANFSTMGSIVHPYPTYGEVFQKLGKRVLVDNIFGNPIVKLFRRKS